MFQHLNLTAPLDPPYQFRFILDVDWDLREDMDKPHIAEFLK